MTQISTPKLEFRIPNKNELDLNGFLFYGARLIGKSIVSPVLLDKKLRGLFPEYIHELFLEDISVKSELRGNGFGSYLLEKTLDVPRQAGKIVLVEPSPDKGKTLDLDALFRFYQRHGFVRFDDPRFKDYLLFNPLVNYK